MQIQVRDLQGGGAPGGAGRGEGRRQGQDRDLRPGREEGRYGYTNMYTYVYVCVILMRWCVCFFGTGRSPMVRAPCAHTHITHKTQTQTRSHNPRTYKHKTPTKTGGHPQGVVALPQHALQRLPRQGQAPLGVEAQARPRHGPAGVLQVRTSLRVRECERTLLAAGFVE